MNLQDAIDFLLNASPPLVLVIVLNFLGYSLKRTPRVPNWTIPWALFFIGAIVYPFAGIVSPWAKQVRYPFVLMVLLGAGLGAISVWGHQAIKGFRGRNGDFGDTETITKPK